MMVDCIIPSQAGLPGEFFNSIVEFRISAFLRCLFDVVRSKCALTGAMTWAAEAEMKGQVLAIGLLGLALLAPRTSSAQQPWENIPRLNIYQVAYPVEWNGKTIMLGARLQVPTDAHGKMPAVIMMHGTGGIRYSGVYYAAALNGAGITTLEVDQWGGRGLPGGASSRPAHLGDNLGDIAGAYRLLRARPDIDTSRIGLFGESMGGIESLLMMTQHNSDAVLGPGVHMRAAVALYPICWLYNHVQGADFRDLVDAPIRIMVGSADDYDGGGDACRTMIGELSLQDGAHVSLRVFPGATHIFDSFTAPYQFNDPGANRRHGGVIHVRPDPEARQQARDDMVSFFRAALEAK
jgi:dienelactone hydrolase